MQSFSVLQAHLIWYHDPQLLDHITYAYLSHRSLASYGCTTHAPVKASIAGSRKCCKLFVAQALLRYLAGSHIMACRLCQNHAEVHYFVLTLDRLHVKFKTTTYSHMVTVVCVSCYHLVSTSQERRHLQSDSDRHTLTEIVSRILYILMLCPLFFHSIQCLL